MPESKQLKFSFAVDEASAQRVKNILRELTQEAEKFANALKGAQGPGGGGGSPFFGGGNVGAVPSGAQTVGRGGAQQAGRVGAFSLESVTAFKNLSVQGQDSLRQLGASVRQSVSEQRSQFESLNRAVLELTSNYRNLQGMMGAGVPGPGATSATAPGAFTYVPGGGSTAATAAALGAPGAPAPPGGGGRVAGVAAAAAGGGGAAGFGLAALRRLAAPAAGIGLIGDVGKEFQSQYFQDVRAAARHAQAFGTLAVETRKGDLSNLAAIQMIRRENPEFFQTDDLKLAMRAGKIPGFMMGLVTRPAGAFRDMSDIEVEAEVKEAQRKFIEQKKQSMPDLMERLGTFTEQAEGNLGMMRRMQMGEVPMLQMFRRNAAFSRGEVTGAFESVRGGGLGFANRNMGAVLGAMTGGMGAGAAGQILTAAAPGGRASRFLASFGGLDAVAAERAGIAAGAQLQTGGPIVSGVPFADAMTRFGFGRGSAMDTVTAGYTGQALAGLKSIGGGADPMGRGIRILTAERVLGPGTSIASRDYLTNISTHPELISQAMSAQDGTEPPELRMRGITWSQVRNFYQQSTSQDLRARIPGIFSGSDKVSTSMNKLFDVYGGDITAFRRGEVGRGKTFSSVNEARVAIGAGLQAVFPQTVEGDLQAQRMSDILFAQDPTLRLGAGGAPRGRRGVSGGQSADYLKRTRTAAETSQLELLAGAGGEGTGISPASLAASMKEGQKLFKEMGNISTTAASGANSLAAFTAAVDKATPALLRLGGDVKGAAAFEADLKRRRQEEIAQQMKNEKASSQRPEENTTYLGTP